MGLAIGSVIAAKAVPIEQAVKVLPLGIAMGFVVLGMVLVTDWRVAILILFCDALSGLSMSATADRQNKAKELVIRHPFFV